MNLIVKAMETKNKKNVEKAKEQTTEKPKSAITLFWEKYPNGYGGGCEIINERAVLR